MFYLFIEAIFIVFICLFFVVFISAIFNFVKHRQRYTVSTDKKSIKKSPITFCLDLGKMIGWDLGHHDPNKFAYKGIYLFLGEQGSGKTYSAVHTAISMQRDFPKSCILSNTPLSIDSTFIDKPEIFYNFNNGTNGTIVLLDEVSAWYNSKASKNMPPEMFTIVTTNRKNKRVLLCTAQNLYMVSKDIRTQATYLIDSHCILGCFNVNIYRKPTFDADGLLIKSRFVKLKVFLQEQTIRDCYDTNAMITFLGKVGFNERKQS